MQKWFWYLVGWLVLALFAFVIIPECSRDSQRRSYIEKQAEQKVKVEALAQQKKKRAMAEEIRVNEQQRHANLMINTASMQQRYEQSKNATQTKKEAEIKRRQSLRTQNEMLHAKWSQPIKDVLSKSLQGKAVLKSYLRAYTTADLQALQGAILTEETYHIEMNSNYDILREVQAVRLQIDVEMSGR